MSIANANGYGAGFGLKVLAAEARAVGALTQRPPIYKSASKTAGRMGNDFNPMLGSFRRFVGQMLCFCSRPNDQCGGGGAYDLLAIWERNFHLGSHRYRSTSPSLSFIVMPCSHLKDDL